MNLNRIANQVEEIQSDVNTFIDNTGSQVRELSDRLLQVEQSPVSNSSEYYPSEKLSISKEIKTSPEITGFLERKSKSAGISVSFDNLLPRIANNTTTSTPATNPTQQLPGVVAGAERRMFLRQLLQNIPATSSSYTYTRELTFTNNAEAQSSEGATKAETDITFEEVVEQVSTYAHWLKTSRQVMSDNPALIDFKVRRLQYGLDLKIEDAMINGDGTAGTLSGLLNVGNFTSYTPVAGDTAVDSIRKGILALQNSDFEASLVIMNLDDVADIELLKDADNDYIVGKPIDGGLSTIWGAPLHATSALAAGTFIVLDTQQAVTVHERQGALVEFSNSDGDNFVKNLVTMLAEVRLGFAVHLPSGVISGALVSE